MSEARRTLGRWLLAAFLERGCDPTTTRIPEPLRRERPLTAHELATLTAPLARIVRLRRWVEDEMAEERAEEKSWVGERSRSWVGKQSGERARSRSRVGRPAGPEPVGGSEARILAFPAVT